MINSGTEIRNNISTTEDNLSKTSNLRLIWEQTPHLYFRIDCSSKECFSLTLLNNLILYLRYDGDNLYSLFVLSVKLLHTHTPGTDGDSRCQEMTKRKKDMHRGWTPWEEVGSFLNFVDCRCCADNRDGVKNDAHQWRPAGRAGTCCPQRDAWHMWMGLEEQKKTLFCQSQPCDIHLG